MRRFVRSVLALCAMFLVACSSTATRPQPAQRADAPTSSQVIELVAAGGGTYAWKGEDWTLSDLEAALIAEDRQTAIERIHLSGDQLSVGNAIEVARLAKAVGAEAFLEQNGEFRPVIFTE